MKKIINKIYLNQAEIYKTLLFICSVVVIVYMFPVAGKFKYDFQKGKPWQYDNLYTPFDFAIKKTDEAISEEKQNIEKSSKLYFEYKKEIYKKVISDFKNNFELLSTNNTYGYYERKRLPEVEELGLLVINELYKKGFLDTSSEGVLKNNTRPVILRKGNEIREVNSSNFMISKDLFSFLDQNLEDIKYENTKKDVLYILSGILKSNVFYDHKLTQKSLDDLMSNISYTSGLVTYKELIILKGDIVEGRKYSVLSSLEGEYSSQVLSSYNYYLVIGGYSILVAFALLMLVVFLYKYRREIYEDNSKLTFILFNVIFIIFLQTIVLKYQIKYIYVLPVSILPIILKTFFDARLALFVHIITIMVMGFIVPNSFDFIYLQIIAGIVAVMSVDNLYKRANLFSSVALITLSYMLSYFAFSIIQERDILHIKTMYFAMFAVNGVMSFLSLFFIWIYEKIFGLISDITLLELSHTNSPLLRELNEKAPGTFQHSMQVANLAESVANEIGANALMVRTGALYHDIGKMVDPLFFTENQTMIANPQNELSPEESAKIIIDHVLIGIELAKKNSIPDRIIDFIRTHHGTNLVYYFYNEQKKIDDGPVDEELFRYKGPIPFSKETAILMVCNSVEAATKS